MPDEASVSEPGPNFSSFGGAGAAGGIIGTNNLQTAIDKLSQAVDKFQTSVDTLSKLRQGGGGTQGGMPQSNGLGSNWNSNGFTTFAQGQPQGPYSPYMPGAYQTAASSPYSSGNRSPYQPNMGGQLGGTCTSTGSFGSQSYTGSGWYGRPGGPGGWGGPGPNGPGGGGIPGYTPPPSGGGGMTFGQLGATVAGAAGYMGRLGAAAMPTQLALNTAQQQMQLYSPLNSNTSAVQSQLQYGLGGTQGTLLGGGRRYPMWAQNGPDQMAAYSAIGATTGSFPSLNGGYAPGTLAQGLYQGMASTSYLNPAMSGTQAEQLMQGIYNPQFSLRSQMLGYQGTPLTMGKPGARTFSQFATGQFLRWGMGSGGRANSMSPGQLQAELGPNGIINQNLQAEGLNQSQIQGMTPDFEAYWRLYKGANGQRALGTSAAQQLMNGLGSTNVNTQNATKSQLARYGINTSDLTNLKQMAGSQTAMQADQSQGFTAGVHEFSQAVQAFDNTIQKLINQVGGQNAEGFGKGFLGSGSSFGGPGWGAATGIGGYLLGKGLLGKILGGASESGIVGRALSGGGDLLSGLIGKLFGGGLGGGMGSGVGFGGGGIADALGGIGAAGAGLAGGGLAAGGLGFGLATAMTGHPSPRRPGESQQHYLMRNIHSGQLGPHAWAQGHERSYDWSQANKMPGGAGGPGATMNQLETAIGGKFATGNDKMVSVSGAAHSAVKLATTQKGAPYVTGEDSPGRGFDCSGLIEWAYRNSGVYLPRTALDQFNFLRREMVAPKSVQAGDVVWKDGPGPSMHEAMLISANELIESANVGDHVKTRPYNAAEWRFAARPTQQNKNTRNPVGTGKGTGVKQAGGAPPAAAKPKQGPPTSPGGVTGQDVVNYAKHFLGQPYEFGGGENGLIPGRPGPFTDCSGLTYIVYTHLGIGQGMVANAASQQSWVKKSPETLGGLAFFLGSDSPGPGRAGHVGIVTGKGQMINDPHTGATVSFASDAGNLGFGVSPSPNWKGGGGTGGSTPGGGSGGGNLSGQATPATLSGSAPGGAGNLGAGDTPMEGSTPETAAFSSAISGMGASSTNGITSTSNNSMNPGSIGNIKLTGSGGSPGNVPAGSGGTGIAALAKYLVSAGYSKAAAAGMAGVAGGEGTGANPEVINCVPLTYKVVTTRGILKHHEVRVGDRTLVYSPHTNKLAEAVVLDIPYHYDARICRIGNDNWSVICTWDHKWITSDGELVRADRMEFDTKVMLGDGWYENIEYFEDMGREDTFCLTTTSGTWTAFRDEDVARGEGVDPGEFWTGNSGGAGLIGWTPPSAMISVGGTCHAAGIGHLSTAQDMANQEKAMVKWATNNGFGPPQNRFPNTLAGAMQAAFAASAAYERPAVPGSDVHAGNIAQAWSSLATGGPVRSGQMAIVGERGPELVRFGSAAEVLDNGTSTKLRSMQQSQHRVGGGSFTSDYVTSNWHPAYSAIPGTSTNGGTILNVGQNAININMSSSGAGGAGMPTASTAREMASQMLDQLSRMNLHNAITSGVNS